MNKEQIKLPWDDWKIIELIGEGASGKVYKAQRGESLSAIKIIKIPQNESEIKEAMYEGMNKAEVKNYFKGLVDDLIEEITLLETLKDAKGIVGISDYKVIEENNNIGWTIYIRMELLTGINEYINDNSISENDIVNLGIDLCEALEYCEKLKIIHRDIKPENIFISKFGEYKLGDFGIARKLENTSSIMSKKGTYLYMAPEVYKGEKYDKSVDIYSLGLVMYKIGNGNRTPFLPAAPANISYRDKETSLVKRMQGETIPKPENMSDELFKVISKMVAYKVEDRCKNAHEVREALEKIKEKNVASENKTVNIFSKTPKSIKKDDASIKMPTSLKEEKVEEKDDLIKELPVIKEKKKLGLGKILVPIILLLIVFSIGILIFLKPKGEENKIAESTITIPNLLNMTEEEAKNTLEDEDLEIIFQDTYKEGAEKGTIVYQSILQDTEVEKGSKLVLFVNNLEKDDKVEVINVVGMKKDQAKTSLENLGLVVKVTEQNSDDVTKGIVISQSISKSEKVNQGTKIEIVVSSGSIQKKEEGKSNTSDKNTSTSNSTLPNNNSETNNNNTANNNTSSNSDTENTTKKEEEVTTTLTIGLGDPYIEKGKSRKSACIINPTQEATVTWKSSNTSVATVASDGTIKGIKAGVVTITATIKGTNITATEEVYIYDISNGKGDVNGDGVISSTDAAIIGDYAHYYSTDPEKVAIADLNGNGIVDDIDVEIVLYIYKTS